MQEFLDDIADPETLTCDGLDEAFIGLVERFGTPTIALYDLDKLLALLMKDGMSYDEAVEYYQFNIVGAWVGEFTPAFVTNWFRYPTPTVFPEQPDPTTDN